MESCDLVDTLMVEKSKLDEDLQGKAVDPTHYRGMDSAIGVSTRSQDSILVGILAFATLSTRSQDSILVGHKYPLHLLLEYPLGQERIKILIDKLGMRSFTPENLKELADEAEE
ncbi:hypothetical protein Tco_1528379 [Tanacetum coccineum]